MKPVCYYGYPDNAFILKVNLDNYMRVDTLKIP